MSYAIRFLPRDPVRRDEPALYLSVDPPRHPDCAGRVTSCARDMEIWETEQGARYATGWHRTHYRCERDGLVADVVPFSVAFADCADVEVRP